MSNRRLLPRARKRVETKPAAGDADTPWFRIENRAERGATVHIYNEIGGLAGLSAAAFTKELADLDVPTIELRLNSPGGDVHEGIAIHGALARHPAFVHVHVDGIAASIASVIAMAGDKVTMAPGSQLMIHEGHTVAVGSAEVMAKTATVLDKASDNIAGFYASRAGGTVEQWRTRMKAETWYSAEEAVQAGLADEVAPAPRGVRNTAQTQWDLTVFNYAGRKNAPAPDLTAEPEPVEEPAEELEPGPATAVAPAAVTVPVAVQAQQIEDVWNDLVNRLVGPPHVSSTKDAVFAALVEAM